MSPSEPFSLTELSSMVVKRALQVHGADEAEAFAVRIRGVNSNIKLGNLDVTSSYEEAGIGIRVVVDKRVGFAFTNHLSFEQVDEAVRRAVTLARASPRNERWPGLPGAYSKYAHVRGTYDEELASATSEDLISKAKDLLREISDPRITLVRARLGVAAIRRAVVNSNGVCVVEDGTVSYLFVNVVAGEAGNVSPGVFEYSFRRRGFPDVTKVIEEATWKALSSLKPVKIKSGAYPVILAPKACWSLFRYTLSQALKGDNAVRGRSPYCGKLGSRVMDEKLSIIDEGTLEGGLNTWSFDDEGVATQKTVIVSRGVLKGFIYDTYWASLAGTSSTGNAWRLEHPGYTGAPQVDFSNFVIEPGDIKLDALISDLKEGLLVDDLQGAHSSNPETGEFSVVATPAWLVSRGELRAVKGVMIAGRVYELLSNVGGISRERVDVMNFRLPWMLFRSIRVIAG